MPASSPGLVRVSGLMLVIFFYKTQIYYFQEFKDDFKRQWLEGTLFALTQRHVKLAIEGFGGHKGLSSFHSFGGLHVRTVWSTCKVNLTYDSNRTDEG